MRSLLFSVDYVYKQDGSLTPLELNTATLSDFPTARITQENFTSSVDGFYEHEALDTFMSESNFTKLVTIAPTGSVGFFRNFAQYYGYEFTNHNTLSTDVTVPYVEDADDTLIIRIAYNTYAIVDDLYARDNYEFHNLIQSESFASPIAFTTNSLDTVTQFDAPQSASYPNYVIKARFPEYEKTEYPKLFNITSSAGLTAVKSTLNDNDFLQKYEFNSGSSLEDDGRALFLRSMNLAIGNELESVLNISNYSKANSLSTTNTKLIIPSYFTGSNRELNKIPAAQWYPTYFARYSFNYHNDINDNVVASDGTLLDYSSLAVNSPVKGVNFQNTQLDRYQSGSLSDLKNLSFSSSSVVSINTKTEGGIFVNITASFVGVAKSWHDGYGNSYLTYRDGAPVIEGAELGYLKAGTLKEGDKIYAYDSASNDLITGSISSFSFEYKPIEVGSISLSPTSQFLVQAEAGDQNLFLIQHNNCESLVCGPEGGGTCMDSQCEDCGKSSKFCIDCNGASTTTCFS